MFHHAGSALAALPALPVPARPFELAAIPLSALLVAAAVRRATARDRG